MLKITTHDGKTYLTESIMVTTIGYFLFETHDCKPGKLSTDDVRLIEPYITPDILGEHSS